VKLTQVSVTHEEWNLLKEAWTASSATKHKYGCIEDMELPYTRGEIMTLIDSLQKKLVIRVPLEREKVDDRVETRFIFEINYRVPFEKFAALFLVGGSAKVDEGTKDYTKKGGDHMSGHTLSTYDAARKALKEAKIKTDTVMTKDALVKFLLKQKDPSLHAYGEQLKAEIDAKDQKKKDAERAKKDAAKVKEQAKKAAAKDKTKDKAEKADTGTSGETHPEM